MVNYREILRLHSLNYGQREIAASIHSSRSTIQEVLNLASALKISWPLTHEVSNAVLETLLYPERAEKSTYRMHPDFPKIHKELAQKGVTLSLLWIEYCAQAHAAGKVPYMSSQFGDLYRKWAQVSKATMRIQRKPGDTFEVDWAGKTIDIYDDVTGKANHAYLFVGALSCSIDLCGSLWRHEIRKLYQLPCACLYVLRRRNSLADPRLCRRNDYRLRIPKIRMIAALFTKNAE